MEKFDFSGWATKNDLQCSDGRVIRHNAFRDNDGKTVPLVWNHKHEKPENVLGHALLENRDEGVYCYGTFNDTENGQLAKILVKHGDIEGLSIYANKLKQIVSDVVHGNICEVSLVHATANPGAFIDTIIAHSDENDEEMIIYADEGKPVLRHSEEENAKKEPPKDEKKEEGEETVADVFNTLNEKQKTVVYAMISQALEEGESTEEEAKDDDKSDDSKGGNKIMKHNVFDQEDTQTNVLMHSDQEKILNLAKSNSVGSLQTAISIFAEQNPEVMAHGIDNIETLFPDYKDVRPGAPEMLTTDQGWVGKVLAKVHKSPISRIRTRQADLRNIEGLRAKGYKKGAQKGYVGNIKLLHRTTDPQTVFVKSKLDRDDIVDITDFDVVQYMYGIDRMNCLLYTSDAADD